MGSKSLIIGGKVVAASDVLHNLEKSKQLREAWKPSEEKPWTLVRVCSTDAQPAPWSVRLRGREQYILSNLDRWEAADIEKMLNAVNVR